MERCLLVSDVGVSMRDERILKDISFQVNAGQITALIGHNGAGKSTVMKTIMGWQKKSKGKIMIQDKDLDEDYLAYKRLYSYIPEEPMLLSELTVYQHFQLYGKSYRIDENALNQKVDRLVYRFDIEDKMNEYPEALSKGMRQKVQSICALLPDVPLLLIDEPFMGLDVYSVDELLDELKERKKKGTAILITSHQLDKIKDISDEYVMLRDGHVYESGKIDRLAELKRRKS
ncbi:ABC-2 type transport system ATP-binding protein [Melghiribacillus thermohalophilus]|uniref:ABC-2 type transport system ATP-binding protein n=1 Tax=Melghiribacillus thermohalophilus TaxID=1324956 RepID=A0A4R3MV25_9BACI|nr:ABC-2 type transport system ATP-binding protein [Melghiribacillus thermohalophilus]